ncbi:MAG: hypothetical protein CMJ59_18065 [Planctomycetaceae bacterium]|nr:hypothetical protein [Planctomycetaceae bacterium]
MIGVTWLFAYLGVFTLVALYGPKIDEGTGFAAFCAFFLVSKLLRDAWRLMRRKWYPSEDSGSRDDWIDDRR